MMDDPISHFIVMMFGVMIAGFVIGFLLFQCRLSVAWCVALAEAVILVLWFVAGGGYPGVHLAMNHIVGLPILLAPLVARYCFNKFMVVRESDQG